MSCVLIAQGRVGKIQQRSLNNGASVLDFSVASRTGFKDKEGNPKTEWTDFEAWGKHGEALFKVIHVGDIVSVMADKVSNKSTDKEGKTRYFTSYRVSRLDVLSFKKSPADKAADDAPTEAETGEKVDAPPVIEFPKDDIPF